jgi:hypothetical protein
VVIDLSELETSARRYGWASGSASVADVRLAASRLGWKEIAARANDPSIAVLRPMDQQQANPRSLSATCGMGAQPLHTDGAHLSDPPDLVFLIAAETNCTPTLLWNWNASSSTGTIPWDALGHGVFLVSNGRDSFYATARLGSFGARVRYDPGCMIPCDQRARMVAQYFADVLEDAREHQWATKNSVLVIDNRGTLHARAAVSPDDRTRELQRIMFATSDST